MAKVKDRAKPSIPPVAPGTYSAICVGSIDIGEQLVKYKDKSNYSNQVAFIFELVGEYIEVDGKQEPRTLSRKFTFSKSEKSGLRKFVESWQGKKFSNEEFGEFDTNDMVGKEAMIGVVLNDTGEYANICLDNKHFSYWKSVSDHLPVHYPGTGDLFAAVLTGSLLEGDSLPMAMDRATRYVELTIKTTYSYSTDPREGVMLERTLEWLTRREASKAFLSL